MTINGEPVVEVDYSALHTTILYNVAGVRLNGEPYDVNGFERDHVKLRASILRNRRKLGQLPPATRWDGAMAIGPQLPRPAHPRLI